MLWSEAVQELVREAVDELALRGYDQLYKLEPIEEVDMEMFSQMFVGCIVTAKNADGTAESVRVTYPRKA